MKPFNHVNAKSLDEVTSALKSGTAVLNAGGTDLLGALKDDLFPFYPQTVVNLKTVAGLDYIKEEDGELKIGALTRLADVANAPAVKERFTALAEAAHAVATPHIREMGTIGGTICQMPRCWYFRKADDRFKCIRKGGTECFAALGQNRFHSIFGGEKICASGCTSECPAGTDIPRYMQAIREGDWDKAAGIIMEVNPVPAITSRVCAHFCQQGCNRGHADQGVLVGGVERAVADHIMKYPERFYKAPAKETGKSVAIVGAGPAGLSAAFYLRQAGNRVTVYDAKEEPGGMPMYAIPAYRMPKDIVRDVIKALKGMGIEFVGNTRVGVDVEPQELEKKYDSLLFTTGAWKRPVLGLSGEELAVFGLDFLVEVHKWMEGKVGKEVLVTGGGNVAMDVAITAKRLGAGKVTMACLEPRERMPAGKEEIARAEEEGITIMPGWGLGKVVEENGKVKGMELKRCLSPWDAAGRFNPQYDENDVVFVEAENILMATGQKVDLSFLDEKYQIQLNQRGLIDADAETQMTNRPGVFAGGDVTTGPKTVIASIASGHKAAKGINGFLKVEGCAECGESCGACRRHTCFDSQGIKEKTAMKLRELDADKRRLDLEDSLSPTREEALKEASRCLNCGCYAVNPSDVAPALIALGAKVVTTERTVDAESFFDVGIPSNTVLREGEIVTEIRIPELPAGAKSHFKKFSFRKAIDFPVVNVAVVVNVDKPRVCLNAVAPTPVRAYKAEEVLAGKPLNEELAAKAGEAAIVGADTFEDNNYKVQIAKTTVKRALLETL